MMLTTICLSLVLTHQPSRSQRMIVERELSSLIPLRIRRVFVASELGAQGKSGFLSNPDIRPSLIRNVSVWPTLAI